MMLFPKKVRHMLASEHGRFIACYEQMLDKQKKIMYKRGEDRDNESPIYFRRSPEMNLGVAQSKIHRIEALLSQLNTREPAISSLKKIIEECLDAANYLAFIAVLCSIVLDEEEDEAIVSLLKEEPGQYDLVLNQAQVENIKVHIRLGNMPIPSLLVGYGISMTALHHIRAEDYFEWREQQKKEQGKAEESRPIIVTAYPKELQ